MYRRVLSRAAFPNSVSITSSQSRPVKGDAKPSRVSFVSPAGLKNLNGTALPWGFKGTAGEVGVAPSSNSKSAQTLTELLTGLGPSGHVRDYRTAVTAVVKRAIAAGASSLTIDPPREDVHTVSDIFHPARPLTKDQLVEKTACFAVTAAYEYKRLKTIPAAEEGNNTPSSGSRKVNRKGKTPKRPSSAKKQSMGSMSLFINSMRHEAIKTGEVVGMCVNDARNLGNLREDEGVPDFFVEWTKKHVLTAGDVKLRHHLRGDALRKEGLNLLHSVGKGSIHQPSMMILEYIGNKRSPKSTALVGKGVTFDCGGLNLKPYGSMETMHMDMMGAATVLSTMKAAATLKLPVNLVAAVGLVENAIGPDSYFPSSIITSLKGLTVEVLNTDAEGRLVLADVLTYVQKHAKLEKQPHTIIDLATLTGAIIASLGTRRAGLFCNNSSLSERLMSTGTHSGEELWPMPIGEEHLKVMRGGLADLVNCAPAKAGGSCTAAAFLSNFVESGNDWAHLDIAGAADGGDKPQGFQPAGAPGFGVQLLVDYLRRE